MSLRDCMLQFLKLSVRTALDGTPSFYEKINYYMNRQEDCIFAAHATEGGVWFRVLPEAEFDEHINEYIGSVDIGWEIQSSQINSEIAHKMARELLDSFESDTVKRFKAGKLDSQKPICVADELLNALSPEPTWEELQAIAREGQENPLTMEQSRKLLRKTFDLLKSNAEKRGDKETFEQLSGDLDKMVDDVLHARFNEDEWITKKAAT